MYLVVIFVSYLLLKALWVQLDIASQFRHGFVSVNYCFRVVDVEILTHLCTNRRFGLCLFMGQNINHIKLLLPFYEIYHF